MAVKCLVMAAILVAVMGVELCPVWSCALLDAGVCAEIDSGEIHMSTTGCAEGMFCSKSTILRFYSQLQIHGRDKGTIRCLDFSYDSDEPNEFDEDDVDDVEDEVNCSLRNPDQELASGNHPKQCSFASDCRTREGKDGSCVCGMDGIYWCEPNWGSSVFNEFWESCMENHDRIDIDVYNWWSYRHEQYVDLQSAPECKTHLYEWGMYEELEDAAIDDWSVILYLAVIINLL
jgi:hypothetical protein